MNNELLAQINSDLNFWLSEIRDGVEQGEAERINASALEIVRRTNEVGGCFQIVIPRKVLAESLCVGSDREIKPVREELLKQDGDNLTIDWELGSMIYYPNRGYVSVYNRTRQVGMLLFPQELIGFEVRGQETARG